MEVSDFNDNKLETLSHLREGGLLVYPTETLPGLGADPHNEMALKQLFSLKQREPQKPLSLLVKDVSMAQQYAVLDNWEFISSVWSEMPVTFVLKAKDPQFAANLGSDTGFIGIRTSQHAWVQSLFEDWDLPLVSTSANLSGAPMNSKTWDLWIEQSPHIRVVPQVYEMDLSSKGTSVVRLWENKLTLLRAGDVDFQSISRLALKSGISL